MKSFVTLLAGITFATTGFGQGQVDFMNSSATLISAGGTAMPGAKTQQFIFALFLAPSATVTTPGQTVAFDDPRFQRVAAYNTNAPTTVGRLVTRRNVGVVGLPGDTVDFVVRGWSADMGATWAEALANYGSFPFGVYGSSTVGNDLVLGGGAIPVSNLFGQLPWQVGGFSMSLGCLGPYFYENQFYVNGPGTVVQGATATFGVHMLACPGPDSYQWYFNASPIVGANTGQYQIANVQPSHAGNYRVIVSSTYWGIHQRAATLTVLTEPIVTMQPQPRTAELGAQTQFFVQATGSPPLAYRWSFNSTLIPMSTTTNPSLQLTNLQFSQTGVYSVVVSNTAGAVTSAPAMLNVIAPVERRAVPRLSLSGQLGTPFNLEYSEALAPTQSWNGLVALDLTNNSDFYFDLAAPLPPQRFYRAWQTTMPINPPSLGLNMVPALTLRGIPGDQIRVEGINQFGPTDAWSTLATVTLTNTSQLYFDMSAPGQPARLYRLVPAP